MPGETSLPGWRVIASIIPGEAAPPSLSGTSPLPRRERIKVRVKSPSNLAAEFDLHKVGTELFIRKRRPGDRFQPLGMDMPKKLQDFMVDAKIPLSWRQHIPLVCSPQQIIWVMGWRIGDRVKLTEASKKILRLEFTKSS